MSHLFLFPAFQVSPENIYTWPWLNCYFSSNGKTICSMRCDILNHFVGTKYLFGTGFHVCCISVLPVCLLRIIVMAMTVCELLLGFFQPGIRTNNRLQQKFEEINSCILDHFLLFFLFGSLFSSMPVSLDTSLWHTSSSCEIKSLDYEPLIMPSFLSSKMRVEE